MPIRRGDVVTVATFGDFGKPRPAVVVQSDILPDSHLSVVVCQMTSEVIAGRIFRVTIEPSETNGLRLRSQVMVDKPMTVLRRRIGASIGRLTADEMARVDTAITFVMGLIG
ncbi:MAG TPA: type II toxin-antitoxin system PemK/MazF family toxin [Stellaceae bacterium]|jgi:mRNA interferase MazF